MMRPSISAIVPAYNVEHFIEESLDSLLEQSVAFSEIIVVDDGSTDATPTLLQRYEKRGLITLITTPNHGLAKARNRGLVHAKSDYVYFFDSDDILTPDLVSCINRTLTSANVTEGSSLNALTTTAGYVDLIFFSGQVFFDHSAPPLLKQLQDTNEFYRGVAGVYSNGLEAYAAMRDTGRFSPSACLYVSRRSLWTDSLRFKDIVHEDAELMSRLLSNAKKTYVCPEVLFKRRVRAQSIMTSGVSFRNVIGYQHCFSSAAMVYHLANSVQERTASKQFAKDMAWLYLNACEKSGIKPTVRSVVALSRFAGLMMLLNFSKMLLPPWIYSPLKKLKNKMA